MLGPDTGSGISFGTLLRRLRETAGLTQEELAERAGLTPHGVSALERGARTRPYPHTVRALAEALRLPEEERARLVGAVPRRGSSAPAPVAGPPSTPSPVHAPEAGRTRAAGVPPTDPPAPGDAPPVGAAAPSRARLVVPPTRLFGRDDDLATVVGLLRERTTRLVTLTGPGGVGKTRLVAAVSDELAGDVADGVVQVPLVAVPDPAGVVPAVARALGLAGDDGPDALPAVVEHVRGLDLLLVLDNLEHLLAAATDVALLVASCPRLLVVATSRAPLRVRGEHEHVVTPLALPPPDVRSAEELAAHPAGAMLLDRARASSPGLRPDGDDVRALAEVCRRLSGLPLALELVSARLRLLSPATLLERLDDVTATAAARDMPERQRSVRATLDWSHGLLSTDERTLFRTLGVFRGGATLDAVEAVASEGAGLPRAQVIGLLAALVEHSLVVVRDGADGRVRYDMLEPVAQYARSLRTDADRGAVAAHAAFHAALAETAAVGYERDEQVTWLARTEADEANLMEAVDSSLAAGDVATAARITWSLWLYWWLRGQAVLGRTTALRCLAAADGLTPTSRGRVLLTAATMSFAAGDVAGAAGYWEEALALGERTDDPELGCKALCGTGLAAMAAGDLPAARDVFRAALPMTHRAGAAGVWMRSLAHVWLGTVLMHLGDPVAAVAETERGLLLARDRGDRLSTYVALYTLSQAAEAGGAYGEARGHLAEGIRLSEQTGDAANLAYFLDALAVVEAAEGAATEVGLLLGAAQTIRETVGSHVYGYYLVDPSTREAAAVRAREAAGADAFDDAVDEGRASDPHEVAARVLARTR